jgi:glycine/D-amino acid oxidase-like deaminating enzyme
MKNEDINVDAIVIGGGFYGSVISSYLKKLLGFNRVILLEKENTLLTRASYINQARIHNGYHYPRSFTTAYRSKYNFQRFVKDWPQAVKKDFTKLYAIARRNSKVTARQFEFFCNNIGAKIKPAGSSFKKLFNPRLVEEVFLVEEYLFDSIKLREWSIKELRDANVEIYFSTRAVAISYSAIDKCLVVGVRSKSKGISALKCRYVFNCTYSGLNQFLGDFAVTQTSLKHEVAEIALVQVPDALKKIGITLMDGPFFSMMPFPSLNLHTLSHVRYTPHLSWQDEKLVDPYCKLQEHECSTRVDRMIRDVGRYMPSIFQAKYAHSLFEIKTVLVKNEGDDGRPILFEKHPELPGCYSILGGKIDNIYDVLEKIQKEVFLI